jgi:hypothetical protein
MKKTDLAMIVFIASFSMLIAYFIGNSIFGGITTEGQKVKTIDPISTSVQEPDETVFNKNAINPAVEIQITGSSSPTETNTTDTTVTDTTSTDTTETQ